MIPITLTASELLAAASVGMRRHASSLIKGMKDAHGFDGDGWAAHIEGACGEIAAAKATGRYWPASVDAQRDEDDIQGCQVRTRSEHSYDLNIRARDKDESIFILVTGKSPYFVVRGWIRASDAKRPEYILAPGGRPPAWFVPQSKLNPMSTLP